jgi:Tfp pilus assembly protein PilF
LHMNEAELRSCLRSALLPLSTPKQRQSYSFQQLVVLRTAKGLREAGVSVRHIRKVLQSLQRQLGESRTMSSLQVYASGRAVIVWDGTHRWQPDSGQFLLNFEARPSASPRRLEPRRSDSKSRRDSALLWWRRGVELEGQAQEAACRAYEEAIRLDPSLAEAHVNVGRLYHEAHKLKEAEASYRQALQHCPDLVVACYNLGVVLEDQGRNAAAISAYQRALQLDPCFRAAHCSLAELYERLGRAKDALRHYAAAKRCRPEPQLE